jgi:predicted transposase YbfD/YdcC
MRIKEGQDTIAIDGKTICNSGLSPLHIVSAWSCENRLIIGHQKTGGKGTEIKGIKDILDCLDIEGHIVTTDALGCQKEITEKVIAKGGDYVLQVKKNHPALLETIQLFFQDCESEKKQTLSVDKKRGWVHETRTTVCEDVDFLKQAHGGWKDIRSVIQLEKILTKGHKTSREKRFYISSLSQTPSKLERCITNHWEVENNVHWVLDVRFNEYKSCIRSSHAAENMNLVKKIATNIFYVIQAQQPKTTSLKTIQRRFSKPSVAASMMKIYLKLIHS